MFILHSNICYEYSVNIVSTAYIVIYMYFITLREGTLGSFL
jgi:hypothetical protein